jgi:tetratricopeptide (TPR) repeat protein
MNRHLKIQTIVITITIILVGSLRIFSAQEEIPSKEYRKRLLGNKAFDSGLYDVAMNYYGNYLQDATGNSPAIRDAYFCLIATCLRSNKLDEAQNLYNELKTKFQVFFKNTPEKERILEYWNAEILLKKGQAEKAANIFKNILHNTSADEKELTINALTGLGICEVRQEQWEEAEKSFIKLKKIGKNTKAEATAIQQLILINIIQDNIDKAKQLIRKNTENRKQLSTKLQLLNVYTLIREKKLTEALKKYNLLKQTATAPDTIWYILSYTFANAYINTKDYKQAIPLLEDASIMAPNFYYKEKTTLTLINTLLAAGQSEKIVSTATFFLDTFPSTTAKDKILLRLIEILIKEEKYSKAVNCTSKYLTLTIPSTSDKIKIACETGQILLHLKKYGKAVKYFKYIADNGTNTMEKNKGKYWYAETVLLEKKLEQALILFRNLKEDCSYWREKSTYKIAEIYLKQKKYKTAAKTLESLIANYPKSKVQPSPVFLYATTLKKLGKIEEAISNFVKFAKDNPTDKNALQAYFDAGSLSLDINNYTKGINYFQKILSDFKETEKTPHVLYLLLYANYLAENHEKSIQYANSLLKQYPDSKFALQTLFWQVNYYANCKKYSKALESLIIIENKFAEKPLVISRVLYDKAYFLYIEGKIDDALKVLTKLEDDYSTTPALPKCLYLKGDILSSEGKYLDAISQYLKATQVAKNPDLNSAAWGRVGDCYFAMINYAKNKEEKHDCLLKAVDYYHKIIEEETLSPLFRIQTLYKLGKCYECLNEKEKAITIFHEAVYGTILNTKHGENPNIEWFAKSGIALARLLQEKNTPITAEAAISVYKTLIKYNIQPVQDFKQRIKEITNNYKLKE